MRFDIWSGGWSFSEHWEIHVKKVDKFTVSSVNPITGIVNLDSNDFNYVPKKGGGLQRGAVHEFGHMLGLADEYKVGTPYTNDINSIMNSGESVRNRHNAVYTKWLDKVLALKGIQ